MGCIISKLLTPRSPPSNDAIQVKFSSPNVDEPRLRPYGPEPNSRPLTPSLPESPLKPKISISIPQEPQSRVQLHTPIYVAIQSYQKTEDTHISVEEGDELELIEINSDELRVNHLRSGLSGIIPKTCLQLDVDTPLRLACNDRGIVQQCLMQYNVPGAYLIRRSAGNPNDFVMSISQYNEQHNTFDWHYLICTNPSNHCFYFSQEERLKNIFFSSFQQLIANERVRTVIPLTKILPYSIEFEEDVWKIPFNTLNIKQKIGEGQFGEVSFASWHKGHTTISVAVKKLHIRGVTSTVEREIEAMKKLRNIYIVTLYGISQNPATDELLIVTELMENGDLKSWLKRSPNLPDYSTLLRFCKDICSGMTYLEFRNYVHRDLACRNILLGPHESFVKIADFGLSTIVKTDDTDQRQQAQSEKLPVRWLAPELLDNQAAYSIKSDVWSFGILLIELWLKGGDPYGQEHLTWIHSAVSTGHVHEKPTDCPDDFYTSVICQCLKFESKDRPSFAALRQLFEKWLKDITIY
jgi:hypothetical protein